MLWVVLDDYNMLPIMQITAYIHNLYVQNMPRSVHKIPENMTPWGFGGGERGAVTPPSTPKKQKEHLTAKKRQYLRVKCKKRAKRAKIMQKFDITLLKIVRLGQRTKGNRGEEGR